VATLAGTANVSGSSQIFTIFTGTATLSGSGNWLDVFRLFPVTNGPATAIPYTGNFIAGVVFEVSTGGVWFEGYWWWCAASGQATSPVKCALWNVTSSLSGTVIPAATTTSGALTAGAWNYIPLSYPVPLAVGTPYIAAIGVNGNFPDTSNEFGSGQPYAAGITNGPLSAYSGQTGSFPAQYGLGQSVFTVGGTDPSVSIPLSVSGTDNLWVDVQVTGTPPGYSGSYRLWPNKYDASATTTPDSAINYVIATEVHLTSACILNKISYYSIPGTVQLASHALVYSVLGADTGVLVAQITSPSWSGAAGSGWVSASFAAGTSLPAGIYKVAVYNNNALPDGWSAKDLSYWDIGKGKNGINTGPMFAPNLSNASLAYIYDATGNARVPPYSNITGSTEPGQNTFAQLSTGTPSPVYPYLYVDAIAQVYWVDLEVTPVIGTNASYATVIMTDNTGTGTWSNPNNAAGPPDGNNTSWVG
jgi:hypothetical protein